MSLKNFFGRGKESSRAQRPTHLNHHHHLHSLPYPPQPHRSTTGRTASYSAGRTVTDKVQLPSPTTPIGDQFLQKMVVVLDYQPQEERDLLVRKGERVEVIRKEGDWLVVRNEKGREGYIPKKNCVPPVSSTRRTPRAYRPLPIRPVGSSYEGSTDEKRTIPLYSSSSAGHPLHRYNSPTTEPGVNKMSIHQATSPASQPHRGEVEDSQEGSSSTLDPKHSPSSSSGVASLTDPYSPALHRTYSPETHLESSCSISSHPTTHSLHKNGSSSVHRKHSASDDSGTEVAVTSQLGREDYASTIRCGDSSSEDGSTQRTGSSMKDRPLPVPPSQQLSPASNHVGSSVSPDTPPPVPPRHASLDRHAALFGQSAHVSNEVDQYADPLDSLMNGETNEVRQNQRFHAMQQSRVKSLVDINAHDNGMYTEVFQSKSRRRKTALSERDSGSSRTRRSASFHRQHPANVMSLDRRGSPGLNGDKKQPLPEEKQRNGVVKYMSKFRKYLWGVFVVAGDFEGVDENEVSVKEGEHVLVFNRDDQDWFWVVKHKTDNSEGFVPSCFLKELAVTDSKSQARLESTNLRSTSHMEPLRSRTSSAGTRPINKQMVLLDSSHQYRPRIRSAGAKPSQPKAVGSSMEKVAKVAMSPTPSSPPPPYQELDPTPRFTTGYLSQQDPVSHHSSGMPRTLSQGAVRQTRFHTRPTRTNTSPLLPYPPMVRQPLSSSQQHLSPLESPSCYSYPTTPTSPTGGTLV